MRVGRLEINWLPADRNWNQTWVKADRTRIKVRDLSVAHMRNIIAFVLMKAGEGNTWTRRKGGKGITYMPTGHVQDLVDSNRRYEGMVKEALNDIEANNAYLRWVITSGIPDDARRYRKIVASPYATVITHRQPKFTEMHSKQFYDAVVDGL